MALDSPVSAVLELLAPVEATLFSGWPGIGVLWALECLAWSPSNLSRVALLLARMSTASFDDEQANRPLCSLGTVFRYWMPQTAATLEQRAQVLQLLCDRVREVGWHLCTQQVGGGLRGLNPSCRPRWRGDASGAGQHVPPTEEREFRLKALEQMLDWQPGYDAAKLADAEVVKAYWREVRPRRRHGFSDSERAELLDRFLEADRPHAAFFALSLAWDSVETSRLRELLGKIAASGAKAEADLGLSPHDL